MITRDNLSELLNSLPQRKKDYILRSSKEYCVLLLFVSNAGYFLRVKLTDNFERYQNVSDNGDAILETQEVQELIQNL